MSGARKLLTVDATGHAVAAHPIRAGLGGVEKPGRGSRRGVHGGRERLPARVGCRRRAKRLPCQANLYDDGRLWRERLRREVVIQVMACTFAFLPHDLPSTQKNHVADLVSRATHVERFALRKMQVCFEFSQCTIETMQHSIASYSYICCARFGTPLRFVPCERASPLALSRMFIKPKCSV